MMPTKTKAPATKKAPVKKKAVSKKSGGDQCWPGYEHVPGKTPGSKGSCKKKGS